MPSIETLEKLARALEVPLYQLFYEGDKPTKHPRLPKRKTADVIARGSTGKQARVLSKFRRLLARMDKRDRQLLFYMAQKMARQQALWARSDLYASYFLLSTGTAKLEILLDIYKAAVPESAHASQEPCRAPQLTLRPERGKALSLGRPQS